MISDKVLITISIGLVLLIMSCNKNSESQKQFSFSTKKSPRVLTNQQWLEDLEELYTLLKENHRDLYHKSQPSEYENLYLKIKSEISHLSDHEIIVLFAQFVALAHDGHTRLTLPLQNEFGIRQEHTETSFPSDTNLVFHHLPVEFYWFDDGLYVTKTTKEYKTLIGKKILKINNVSIDTALERARSISHFDNEYGYKLIAPSRLSIIEILEALKISKRKDDIELTFEEFRKTKKINVTPLNRFSKSGFLDRADNLKNEIPIMSRRKNNEYYWYQYSEDKKIIYLQLNQMNDAVSGTSIVKFIGNLNEFINNNEVDRIILDLRNNFGGDNSYSLTITNLIIKNPKLNKVGSFYCLIGRKTFSAAQYLVNDLSKWTNVIFVGEPTGSSPNSFGDPVKKRLPNSNLTIRISTIYWRDWTSDENRKWTSPDIPVENSSTDYFQNKDAALKMCFEFKVSDKLVDTYRHLYLTGGMETAERIYLRVALDWERTDIEINDIEQKLIEWLSERSIE